MACWQSEGQMEKKSIINGDASQLSFFQKIQYNMENEEKTKWGYKLSSLFFLLCIILLPFLTVFFLMRKGLIEGVDNIPILGIFLFNIFTFFWFLFKKKNIIPFNFLSSVFYYYCAYDLYNISNDVKIIKYQLNIFYLYLMISMMFNLFIIKFNNPLLACVHDKKIRKDVLDTKLKIFIYIIFPFFIYLPFLFMDLNIFSLLTIIVCPEFISNDFVYYYVKYIDQKSNCCSP